MEETKRKQREGLEAVLGQHLNSTPLNSCLMEEVEEEIEEEMEDKVKEEGESGVPEPSSSPGHPLSPSREPKQLQSSSSSPLLHLHLLLLPLLLHT